MVIGDDFVWAHLPKTGGDATLAMFRVFPDLVQFADPDDSNDKHAQFESRAQEIRGKVLAMNFRRLPAWVLSRAQHVARRGIYPDYEPQPMGTPDELAESSFPDDRASCSTRAKDASTRTTGCGWSRWRPTSSTSFRRSVKSPTKSAGRSKSLAR